MKIKWTGDEKITIREVTFASGKAVSVDDAALAAKVLNIPGFVEVKRKANDKNKG
jgi:hypothetical protein